MSYSFSGLSGADSLPPGSPSLDDVRAMVANAVLAECKKGTDVKTAAWAGMNAALDKLTPVFDQLEKSGDEATAEAYGQSVQAGLEDGMAMCSKPASGTGFMVGGLRTHPVALDSLRPGPSANPSGRILSARAPNPRLSLAAERRSPSPFKPIPQPSKVPVATPDDKRWLYAGIGLCAVVAAFVIGRKL